MSVLRSFKATDMFTFNNINLDIWTETTFAVYKNHLTVAKWVTVSFYSLSPTLRYLTQTLSVIGKAEGNNTEWHGHVTAISVAPEYRRLSLARKMMTLLEMVSDDIYRGYFVDLYVRCTNNVAIELYEGLGYSVYRRVREYYGNLGVGKGGRDEEDAFDMRKPLSRDPGRRSVRTNGRDMLVSAHDVP
ncbi:related to N-acetyltransferase 5 [Armillaria ostoyae]|uniref:Related to N-acetyltransferase 5 n=1 Tax=Armillaria ostoyae TaxID=47428 RepID=A0A284RTX7_ARMOS|nr:related to N-acetyltransferase 5 [Armillaria ostoyae]